MTKKEEEALEVKLNLIRRMVFDMSNIGVPADKAFDSVIALYMRKTELK